MTFTEFLTRLRGVRPTGRRGEWMARCPAHDDRRASLSVGMGVDGRVLLYCHAGCSVDAILQAMRLTRQALFPERENAPATSYTVEAVYDYVDADGTLRHQTVRLQPKRFLQRRPAAPHETIQCASGREVKARQDPRTGRWWIWSLEGVEPVLYRLPEVLRAAQSGGTVWVVEGEKDADALAHLGLVATTCPMGAGKWRETYSLALRGADVLLVPDNDQAGQAHVAAVARSLRGIARRVRILALPNLPPKGDVSDWLAAGGTREELLRLAETGGPAPSPDDPPPKAPGPRRPDAPGNANPGRPKPSRGDPSPDADTHARAVPHPAPDASEHFTDLGNARRLLARHGRDLHFDHTRGVWLVWTGVRWETDTRALVYRFAKETVAAIGAEATGIVDPNQFRALMHHAARSESRAAIANLIALAASEPGIPVVPSDMDAHPWLLNCLNGTIDLRTGTLRPHRREDLLTKLCPVPYLPDATHPLWEDLLERVTRGRPAVRHYLQRAAGATLVGGNPEDRLFLLVSDGGGGKTTFLEAMAAALGDYAAHMAPDTLLTDRRAASGHSEDLACLAGARLVIASEPGRHARFALALVKLLTGGEAIRASRKYERSFEFKPEFTPWVAANAAPAADDDDTGAWRRIRKVPWTPIPANERNPHARACLTDPAQAGAAVLAWMVRGCLLWQSEGLNDPPEVLEETEAYRQANNPLAGFLADCCVRRPDAWVPAAALRQAYETWCRENGAKPVSSRTWGDRLRQAGCARDVRRPAGRVWTGIGLLSHETD